MVYFLAVMDEVTLNNKKYLKATEIAKDLGYTSDYVGQLCRAGKVDAQLVGRSWFVNEASLREHKHGTKRSNKAKSQAAVKHYRKSQTNRPRRATHTPHERHITVHHYEADEADLFPQIKRAKEPATEPNPIKVKKKSKIRHFKAAERPSVRFAGALSVSDAEAETGATVRQPASAPISTRITKKAKTKSKTNHVSLASSDEVSHIAVHRMKLPARRRSMRLRHALGHLLFSLLFLCTFALIGALLTTSTEYTGSDASTQYYFDFQPVIDYLGL